VLVELLLGARVFAFLEQIFGLVALAPRVGERERAILAVPYALIRHLEMRNPHALLTRLELMDRAASPDGEIAFTDEGRAMYAELRRHPELQKQIFNMMSADLAWTERD